MPASRGDGTPHGQVAEDVTAAIERLVRLVRRAGVGAVVAEVDARPELLLQLADACRRAGLIFAAQYLDYLYLPYD